MSRPLFLCLAQAHKGQLLLEAARGLGIGTVLLADQSTRGQWGEGAADECFYFPDFSDRDAVVKAVAYLGRSRAFQAVFPLDEMSVEVAAYLRELLGLEGLDVSQAHRFRDKLLMRQAAKRAGIPQPRFSSVLNDSSLREFVALVPGPWYLKPRSLAGSAGIMRVPGEAELWPAIEKLGDERACYLLEESIEGAVYHVDSLVFGHEVVFAQVHVYGESPWRTCQQGGVFTTATVHAADACQGILRTLNERAVGALGLARGVVHAEFLGRDGRFYFLEAAARVAGANIDVLVEKSCGLNLWQEWLKVELCAAAGQFYCAPNPTGQYGAMLTCLARQPWPDLDSFCDPEVVWKLHRLHHAGLVLASSDFDGLQRRLAEYKLRFEKEFLAVLPPARRLKGRR